MSLIGPLGAGKTEFAKGLAEGLGLPSAALASPTFMIAQDLPLPARGGGPRRLVHADCFRLNEPEELEAAGLSDWLAPGTVLLAEWGDRFPESARPRAARGPHRGTAGRRARARGAGSRTRRRRAVLARWRERCP